MKHALLIAEFLDTPWAVKRERLALYAGVVARWSAGTPRAMEDEDFGPQKSAWEARREQAARLGGNGIAVLPLYGTIVQRAGMMTEWSGGASTQQFTQALRAALADETVGSILIDIDSPGGSVYGVQELADEILAARAQKPIVAIANSLAASAAYWIGSNASEFYVTPGGEVGSIGVWSAHEDWSRALAEAGVTTTIISAGKFKTEGNPYESLSPEARDFQQSRVNDYYGAFTRAVAKGRAVPVAQARDGMGQGRVLGADQALSEKMVDGIDTFDGVIKSMQRKLRQVAKPAASRLARAQNELKILG